MKRRGRAEHIAPPYSTIHLPIFSDTDRHGTKRGLERGVKSSCLEDMERRLCRRFLGSGRRGIALEELEPI